MYPEPGALELSRVEQDNLAYAQQACAATGSGMCRCAGRVAVQGRFAGSSSVPPAQRSCIDGSCRHGRLRALYGTFHSCPHPYCLHTPYHSSPCAPNATAPATCPSLAPPCVFPAAPWAACRCSCGFSSRRPTRHCRSSCTSSPQRPGGRPRQNCACATPAGWSGAGTRMSKLPAWEGWLSICAAERASERKSGLWRMRPNI